MTKNEIKKMIAKLSMKRSFSTISSLYFKILSFIRFKEKRVFIPPLQQNLILYFFFFIQPKNWKSLTPLQFTSLVLV